MSWWPVYCLLMYYFDVLSAVLQWRGGEEIFTEVSLCVVCLYVQVCKQIISVYKQHNTVSCFKNTRIIVCESCFNIQNTIIILKAFWDVGQHFLSCQNAVMKFIHVEHVIKVRWIFHEVTFSNAHQAEIFECRAELDLHYLFKILAVLAWFCL